MKAPGSQFAGIAGPAHLGLELSHLTKPVGAPEKPIVEEDVKRPSGVYIDGRFVPTAS